MQSGKDTCFPFTIKSINNGTIRRRVYTRLDRARRRFVKIRKQTSSSSSNEHMDIYRHNKDMKVRHLVGDICSET